MPTDTLKMLQTIRLRSIFTTRISCRKDKTLFSSFLVNHKNTCISLMTLMKTTNHYVVKFNMSFFCFPVFFFLFASSSSSYSLILYRFSALTSYHLFLVYFFYFFYFFCQNMHVVLKNIVFVLIFTRSRSLFSRYGLVPGLSIARLHNLIC